MDKINTNNVILETNKGNIEIELSQDKAPITVENFINYVNKGHYDGTIFHRVINDFMIQGGGFTPDGQQKSTDAPIKLESNNGLTNNLGTIAMARTGIPDSATSQFFINIKDNDFLNYAPGNPGYAVFGKVVSGMEIVNQIKSVKTTTKNGMGDWPVEDIIIEKAYIQ
ncbi:peptidyl-prolyl cis-trans isomerase [Candidatus Woesearchaeota archaeon]|nr:peptidyl-prolyl cis-trans isomerase [Candidatus Woesearchaeota archaeon]